MVIHARYMYRGNFSKNTIRNSNSKVSRITRQQPEIPRGYTYIHVYCLIRMCIYTNLHPHTHVHTNIYLHICSHLLGYLKGPIMGLGQLNLRDLNCLALLGAKFGLDWAVLCAGLFFRQKGFELGSTFKCWGQSFRKKGQKSKVIAHNFPSLCKDLVYCWVALSRVHG